MKVDLTKLAKRKYRLVFYLRHIFYSLKPRWLGKWQKQRIIKNFQLSDSAIKANVMSRVDYYNQLSKLNTASTHSITAKDFHLKGHNSSYFIDLASILPFFSKYICFSYEFGDVTETPPHPTLVKSRPVQSDNGNAVLTKLDSIRHFYIPKDPYHFHDKMPQLVWRGAAHQPHRIKVLEQYNNLPNINLGCVAQDSIGKPYHAEFLNIKQQLEYQFILSIEGNDVATNLKWIMASNSLCFMTKPRYETWFMEGALQPNIHYVLLRDDYADLGEKVDFYVNNPNAAQAIISQAQEHVAQFFDKKQERLIQILTMQKYLDCVSFSE